MLGRWCVPPQPPPQLVEQAGPLCPVQMEDRVQGPQGRRIEQGFIQVTHELNPEGRLGVYQTGYKQEGCPG